MLQTFFNFFFQDKLCGKRGEQQNTSQNRIVGQLLTLMDGIKSSSVSNVQQEKNCFAPVVVLASTEKPKQIDEALRRSGRFDYEVWIGSADLQIHQLQRFQVLSKYFSLFPLHKSLESKKQFVLGNNKIIFLYFSCFLRNIILLFLENMADRNTKGFSLSDLEKLCKESFIQYLLRRKKQLEDGDLGIQLDDIENALLVVRPSHSISSLNALDKPILWDDIGGLEETKALLRRVVEWPLRFPDQFAKFNLKSSKGILLYGPPGCCKV